MKMLKYAVIAENTEFMNIAHITSAVTEADTTVKGMFSLSPTRILLSFDCEDDVMSAVSEGSRLWKIFDDSRTWSEGELYDDRLVWLECYGIHPKCWSRNNIRSIGEKWGHVLIIDNSVDDLHSLTYARILVRTKA